jgi:uncharacterized protein YggE
MGRLSLSRSVVVLAALSLAASVAAAEPAAGLVQVSGSGTVKAVPDEVRISMTVTTIDDDLMRVRADSDKQARTVLELARKHAAASRFEVSRLDLTLDYNKQLRRQIYQVERDVAITLNDLTKLDALLSDLLQQPNCQIVGITFGTSRARNHQFEARRRAVTDAKEKAAYLAELNGLKLGKARTIHAIHEVEAPFVTSVFPVVGAADVPSHYRGGPLWADAEPAPRQVREHTPPARPSFRLVAFQARSGDAPKEANKAELRGKPFALGYIEISASVNIDFELVE